MHLTVAAVVEKDQRFLMVEEMVKGQKVLNQPAGHVETGESFTEAVIRETLEETAWHVEPVSVTGIYRWQIPGSDETFFRHCFSAKPCDFDATRQLDDGIVSAIWLSYDELLERKNELRSPLVLASIEDFQSGQRFPLHLYQNIE